MESIGPRLGKCIGEMIDDRVTSFRRRIRHSPNESLTVRSLVQFKDLHSTISALPVRMQGDYTRAELLRNHSLSGQRTLD